VDGEKGPSRREDQKLRKSEAEKIDQTGQRDKMDRMGT
jgi:hypothetical protein